MPTLAHTYIFQEHNFIKKRPSWYAAGRKRAKNRASYRLCLFFLSIFSVCQHGIPLYPTSPKTLFHSLLVFVSNYSPINPSSPTLAPTFLPLATTEIFFILRMELKVAWRSEWATSSSCRIHRKRLFFSVHVLGMSKVWSVSPTPSPLQQGHLTLLREKWKCFPTHPQKWRKKILA